MGLVRVREGKGTPLVLLPGLREDSSGWLPALPALAARHHVILLDLPGFGAAPPLPRGLLPTSRALAQEVAAELHRLGVARPHVAGFSLGGRVGLELARRGHTRSVVAIAPNGTGTPVEQGYLIGLLLAKRLTARALQPLTGLPGGEHLARLFLATEHVRPWRLDAEQARELLRSFARSPDYLRTLAATVVDVAIVWGRSTARCCCCKGHLTSSRSGSRRASCSCSRTPGSASSPGPGTTWSPTPPKWSRRDPAVPGGGRSGRHSAAVD